MNNNLKDFLKDKSILVTGGTGSFGKKFISTILENYEVRRVIVFSRDELKQFEMQQNFSNDSRLRFFLGDVRNFERLDLAFKGVDIVIHAAALKQVPAGEYNPTEFIETNVHGAQNIIKACDTNDVSHLVALSTDKAANPINLYGATKLVSDKLFVSANYMFNNSNTNYSVVRYGNVAGSRGSVILFHKFVQDNADHFPITDIDMTRFWISLQEGVNFVLNALDRMRGGEIFVPKIPSTKVTDIAIALDPEKEQKIIGIRPGEKIHEVMCPKDEAKQVIEYENHFVIVPSLAIDRGQQDLFLSNKINEKGAFVNQGFEYESGNNQDFLSAEQIKQKIIDLELV